VCKGHGRIAQRTLNLTLGGTYDEDIWWDITLLHCHTEDVFICTKRLASLAVTQEFVRHSSFCADCEESRN